MKARSRGTPSGFLGLRVMGLFDYVRFTHYAHNDTEAPAALCAAVIASVSVAIQTKWQFFPVSFRTERNDVERSRGIPLGFLGLCNMGLFDYVRFTHYAHNDTYPRRRRRLAVPFHHEVVKRESVNKIDNRVTAALRAAVIARLCRCNPDNTAIINPKPHLLPHSLYFPDFSFKTNLT